MAKYLDYEGLQEFKGNLDSVLDPLKSKLDGVEEGATANEGTVTAVSVDGADYIPINGVVSLPNYPTTLPASDVSDWAKAQVKPSYSASEVGLDKVGNFKAVSTEASQGLTSTEQANARANIGAGTGTITGIKMNGASKGSSGVVDLGTIITAHQDISGKVDKTTTVNGHELSSNVTVTKSDVGLGNVTNDAQVKRTEMGVASGVATLDSAGKVPSSQLPSYVDDVLEYDTKSAFPETGEAGKIYVDKSNNTSWRWSGSTYSQIKGDLVIGTTSGTAADGGVANTHYNNTSNPHSVTKAQVGLGSVVNTGDSATPVSGGTTKFTTGGAYTELAKKVDKVTGKGLSTNDYTTDEKNKLSGIASGAEVNQNAFSNIGIKVGETTTTVAADSKTDTVTLIQGSNITLTPDTTNDTVTIAAKDTTYSAATTSAAGLMSSSDKTKLNGIETGALTHKAPTTEEVKSALGTGSGTSKYLREDGTWQTPPDHTYTVNNGTFAVKGAGTQVASTSANASGNSSVDIVAGDNVTITPDATNNKITISSTDTNTWRPVSDSVSSTNSSTSASSKAVKTAYDLAASKTSNTGTVTSVAVKMNGSVKGTVTTNGTIDLGTIITAHQDISGKVDKTTTVNGHALSGNVSVTKSDVGLGNVTNDSQVKRSEMGAANGVATLGSDSLVPSNLLPSYVDDIIEGYYKSSSDKFYTTLSSGTYSGEITPESGKVYVDKSTNGTYRWSGSAYVQIKGDLVIGTSQGNAADGKVVNDHINNTSNPHSVTKSLVGLGNVGNFLAVSTNASQGLNATQQLNARNNIGAGTSSLTLGTSSTTALKGDTKYAASTSAGGDAINADKIDGYHILVVSSMPASPDANTIYIVK